MDRHLTSAANQVPPLREELLLEKAGQTFVLHDALSGKFFRLGEKAFAILGNWHLVESAQIARRAAAVLGLPVSGQEVAQLLDFLKANGLVRHQFADAPDPQLPASRWRLTTIQKIAFLRIPLFRPQRLLDFVYPFLAFLFTRGFRAFLALCMVLALYLTARQWDSFVSTFMSFISIEGAVTFAAGLVLVKCLHELGHALMAVHYGVRVPVAGIAFMLMVPVLFTDTTPAWCLASRRQRMMIDAGGMIAELVVAIFATLAWHILDDGPLRSFVYSIATISWLLSLAINLNPFMRFDGYYLFSGLLGVENLQARAFSLGRRRLRELLFALGEKPPETFEPDKRLILVGYAYATWTYRFFLGLGIAQVAYMLVAKAAGIFLLIAFVSSMVLVPIYREFEEWQKRWPLIARSNRSLVTAMLALVALALFIAPMPTRVTIPAIARFERELALHPSSDAMLLEMAMSPGVRFAAGQVLARFSSPGLEEEIARAKLELGLVETRLRRIASEQRDRADLRILLREHETATTRLRGLMEKLAALEMVAPFDGMVDTVDPELHAGLWVTMQKPVALVHDAGKVVLAGLVDEKAAASLEPGARGRFVPDDPAAPSCEAKLVRLGLTPASTVSEPELSDREGGRVPVAGRPEQAEAPVPHGIWYDAALDAPDCLDHLHTRQRGIVLLEAGWNSLALSLARRIVAVLVREANF
ncbi:MAG: hypothetical protein WBO55_04980 [Rhizobiaceae bacterium]